MIRLLRLLTILCGLTVLVACSDDPQLRIATVTETPTASANQPPQKSSVRVALILKSLSNPFFLEMEKGARLAQRENNIELFVRAVAIETSINQQIQIVDEIIKNRAADAIVITPSDSHQLAVVLAFAVKSGIPVVNIDTQLDAKAVAEQGIPPIPFVGVDNQEAAYQAALQLALELPRGAEVAILEGSPTAFNANQRSEGARRAFTERGLKLVARKPIWTVDEAFSTTSDLMNQHPKLRGIYCVSDLIAIGAIKYLGERSQQQVRLAGFDAIPEARAALQKNQMVATVNQRADEQGYIGVKTALAAIAGTPVPPIILVKTQVLTRTTRP